MRVAREFRILMVLGIFAPLPTVQLDLLIRPLVHLVDSQPEHGVLRSLIIQFLATITALLAGGLAHQSAGYLAAEAGSLIGPISGEYPDAFGSQ